ncbi:hypothetical protein [Reyranella sp. CPCC 100927]|uniref:hypothetical protein n=1 Tax=Reyranella sp. CPCC 100927 TaxID=2599616 RepID=UPI0011B3E331|nr:hypothetical protein [Reyranella sp. CPCC 100927]TWT13712.1 hypothetical protein FQU96_07285 [Reyranella sp. CPCC 100927]
MTIRTSEHTVRFVHPFRLTGMDHPQPAGTYLLETDEELIEELSFPVYRRLATRIFVPAGSGSVIVEEVIDVDPRELQAALENDSGVSDTGAAPTPRADGEAG